MHGKLAAIKNIIWAFGIVLCLGALVVGFIFAAAVKYDGSDRIGKSSSGGEPQKVTLPTGSGTLMTLGETNDGGQAYVDSLTFLCDSALIGLRDYGILSGGIATTQVWGSNAGNIPASTIADCTIRYPGDSSELTVAEAAAAANPSVLVISVGTDGLADVAEEDFIANYTALIRSIRTASPGTRIVCCSIPGVSAAYAGTDGLTTRLTNQANEWIRQICTDTGVYFVDAASAVCDASGSLFSEFASSNGKTLNSAGINEVLLYLRTHTL